MGVCVSCQKGFDEEKDTGIKEEKEKGSKTLIRISDEYEL